MSERPLRKFIPMSNMRSATKFKLKTKPNTQMSELTETIDIQQQWLKATTVSKMRP